MNAAELAEYLRAAALQWRYLLPRRRDRELLARGGTVLHAVDTDVVKLYTAPWEVSPLKTDPSTGQRSEGYAEVFPGENRDLVIGMGKALAEYIFAGLSADLPLILLPPIGEEVSDVFSGVARDAENEADRASVALDEIKQVVKKVQAFEDPSEAVRELAEHAGRIARFLHGPETHIHELRRFAQLMRGTRLAPPEFLIDKDLIRDPVLRTALAPPSDLVDRIRFNFLHQAWFERLRKTKSHAQDTARIDRDARALARLEWINTRLDPRERGAKPMRRLVLITGDHAVHEAARLRPWSGPSQSFADLFLRHPRAYLAEPGVLAPPEEGGVAAVSIGTDTQFDQWLDTWLSEINPGTNNFRKLLGDLLDKNDAEWAEWVSPVVELRPKLVDEFRKTWAAYTRNLAVDRPASELELELRKIQERGVIEDYRKLIERLSESIDQRLSETWESCFWVVAEGSSSLRMARRGRSSESCPSRNPPMLTFDRFGRTREFVEKVLSRGTEQLSAGEWDQTLKSLKQDDKSGYAFFLALGMLFAADNYWRVAAILADRASTIAAREKPAKISGREAAYLRAVSLRHSSRSIRDLAPIAGLIDRAEAGYEQDLADHPTLKAGPCRFQAERWALFLTYHLYRLLLEQAIPNSIPDLVAIQAGIDELLDKIASSDERENVILYTERNLLVGWCMAAFLRFRDEGEPPNIGQLSKHCKQLRINLESPNNIVPIPFYVGAIRSVGSWIIARDPEEKTRWKKEALDWLDPQSIEKNCIMRYDQERFALLREIVHTRLY